MVETKTKNNKSLSVDLTGEVIAEYDFNDERTVAFRTNKKRYKQDSISWIIWGLVLFFFTLFSAGRITVVGQFFDDVIFNFVFGWFKYPVYLILLFVDICIYSGIRFKFKKRFIVMIITSSLLLSWIISLIFMTILVAQNGALNDNEIVNLWSPTILNDFFNEYIQDWTMNSVFREGYSGMDFLMNSQGYWDLYSGGGAFGTFLAGLTSYASIPMSYIFWLFFSFLNTMWIFTGDPFYLFKKKENRRGKSLRILSLKSKNNPNKNSLVKVEENVQDFSQTFNNNQMWKNLNIFGQDVKEADLESDLTIKLPSFVFQEEQVKAKTFIEENSELNETLEINNLSLSSFKKAKENINPTPMPNVNYMNNNKNQQNLNQIRSNRVPINSSINNSSFKEAVKSEPVNSNFIQSRRKKDQPNNQYEFTNYSQFDTKTILNEDIASGKYGNVDPNIARELFNKERDITPFGRNKQKPEVDMTIDTVIKELSKINDDAINENDNNSDTDFFSELFNNKNKK